MMLFSINPAFDLLPPGQVSVDNVTEDMVAGGCKIDPVRQEFYQLCQQENVGLTVMKGYAGGRLFDAQRSPFGVPLTPVQCIHYALTRPAVASVLTGFETPDQLRQALAYCEATDEEKDFVPALEKASHNSYVGQCTYCGHCLPCPQRIDIATVNKFYDLAVMHDELPDSLREHYRNLPVHADACIQCRACESRCPFGVKIADRMIQAKELFQQ
jgi:predicted aldo/keto reductase-like oxidoreductase